MEEVGETEIIKIWACAQWVKVANQEWMVSNFSTERESEYSERMQVTTGRRRSNSSAQLSSAQQRSSRSSRSQEILSERMKGSQSWGRTHLTQPEGDGFTRRNLFVPPSCRPDRLTGHRTDRHRDRRKGGRGGGGVEDGVWDGYGGAGPQAGPKVLTVFKIPRPRGRRCWFGGEGASAGRRKKSEARPGSEPRAERDRVPGVWTRAAAEKCGARAWAEFRKSQLPSVSFAGGGAAAIAISSLGRLKK